jgi:hypothetical protein
MSLRPRVEIDVIDGAGLGDAGEEICCFPDVSSGADGIGRRKSSAYALVGR